MNSRWIVTALGKDRPGIVAGVTKVLYELGCNLEDSAMKRLEGEFTIMLIFSSPASVTEAVLRKAYGPLERRQGLVVHLKVLTGSEASTPKARGSRYLISVYGADRPGIVYRVSQMLSRRSVNIIDVHTHRSVAGKGRREPSLYALLLEVELPSGKSAAWLERELKRATQPLGVETSLRPSEADVL